MHLGGSFSFSTYFALFNTVCLKILFCLDYCDQENPQKYSCCHLGQEVDMANKSHFTVNSKLIILFQAVF